MTTYSYTGSAPHHTASAGVDFVTVEAFGGQGGSGGSTSAAGPANTNRGGTGVTNGTPEAGETGLVVVRYRLPYMAFEANLRGELPWPLN